MANSSNNPSKQSNAAAPGKPGEAGANGAASADTELNARIGNLKGELKELEKGIRTVRGMVANRDPAQASRLQQENKLLMARVALLERALLGLEQESYKPRQPGDEKLQYEIIRAAAVEFCQKHNVDPEIWKSLVS